MSYTKRKRKYKTIRRGLVLIHLSVDPTAITDDMLKAIADYGYETIQVPVLDPSAKDAYVALAKRAAKQGLVCSVVTVCPGKNDDGESVYDPGGTSEQQAAFEDYMASVCEIAKAMQMFDDEPVKVVGPFAEPLGGAANAEEAHPDSARWSTAVATMARITKAAADKGVTLLIEWLNRWEQRLLCTAPRGKQFIIAVNQHADSGDAEIKGLYDSHHAHIEGSDRPQHDVDEFEEVCGGYHASENTRGIIGTGRAPIGEELDQLEMVDLGTEEEPLDVWIEIFSGADPGLAAATCIWDSQIVGQELEASETSLENLDGLIDGAGFELLL